MARSFARTGGLALALALGVGASGFVAGAAPAAPPTATPARPPQKSARNAPVKASRGSAAYSQYVHTWHTPSPTRSAPTDAAGRPHLVLYSIDTNDHVSLAPASERGGFSASDLDRASAVLREPSSGNQHPIEPRLLDAAYRVQTHFEAQEIRVLSGYRTPHGHPSNHGAGRAIDIVVPGASDADVAKFARQLGFVGVGIYPTSGFVHIDVRARSYFWVDASGPGRRNRERGILGDLAQKSDAQASARGERCVSPFLIAPDVDAALRARGIAPVQTPAEDDDRDLDGDSDSSSEASSAGDFERAGVDDDVATLVREERLVTAAEVASARGDFRVASDLFERACVWQRASTEAHRAGDVARAMLLAVEGDDVQTLALIGEVAASDAVATRVIAQLERRGSSAWAARVLEASGRGAEAARAWERGGDAIAAARLYEQAGDPVSAARALEASMRRTPDAFALHVALGELLLRYGKLEAATRALQRVPASATERPRALRALLLTLDGLGLTQAREEARHELEALGAAGAADDRAAPVSRAEVTTRIFGRYEVVREVAATPTARVLECIDAVRGERVAVKVFAGYDARGAGRDALARFEREVRVLGALDHPNVVPLRDYFPDGPAIVLAWMGGGTLEARLALASAGRAGEHGRDRLTPARAVEIATAVLRALGEAHRLGVLDRDIKPSNVLFDDAGVTRLSDFGVAHLGDLSTTATAAVIGTLAYMSPEQRAGKPATVRSDLYGVGALLLEMLTGEKPTPGTAPRLLPSGAHRDLDGRHDESVLALLATAEVDRPADAFVARRALTALPWPDAVEPAAPPRPEARAPSHRPGSARARVALELDGRVVDQWLGRPIVLVPLADATLARAQAFAKAGHPALQSVLRVDRDDGTIWLEAPRGTAPTRPLRDDEARALHEALDALHEAGFVHGHIDAAHVFVDDAIGVMLTFADGPADDVSWASDHEAVDTLAR